MSWQGTSVPTCSVASRTHFDQELACRHSEVRPVVRGSGRRITFTSRCQWQRAVSPFCQPGKFGPAAHACTTEKKKKEAEEEEEEEPIARLKQREKLRSKGKLFTKRNSCNPKVTVTDESSKEGLRWPVWTGGSRSFAVFEQWKGEFIGDGTKTINFGESYMHRLLKQGVPDRLIMATSGNKSFESTKIDSRRTPSTTVDGCLAGRRPLCGRQKKKLAIA